MNTTAHIRPETPQDVEAIEALIAEAFHGLPHASNTEHLIVNALRRAGRLTLSLVAVEADNVIGHVAVSPVAINGKHEGWFALGPLSVHPARQDEGVGSALVKTALAMLKRDGAAGCVVLGDPGYYGRFGFESVPSLVLTDVPPAYFQALGFQGNAPGGTASFDPAFDAIR